MPQHLRPTSALATRAVLTTDPAIAMTLATGLLESPIMSNHSYGLWGYTGATEAGERITVQSTGIGAQSAAIVVAELAELGIDQAVLLGFGEAVAGAPPPGLLVVVEAMPADGASRDISTGTVGSDPALSQRLVAALTKQAAPAPVASGRVLGGWELGADPPAPDGAVARSVEAAAVLAMARTRAVTTACALVAAPEPGAEDPARAELLRMPARAAVTALTGAG